MTIYRGITLGILLGLFLLFSSSSVLANEAEAEVTVTASPDFPMIVAAGAIIVVLLFVFIYGSDHYLGGKE